MIVRRHSPDTVVLVRDVQLTIMAAGYYVTRLCESLDLDDRQLVERESVVHLYVGRFVKHDEQFVVNLRHTSYYSSYNTNPSLNNVRLFNHFATVHGVKRHTLHAPVQSMQSSISIQEQGPSSAIEHFQSLDQSSGTLSPSSSEQPTTFKHSNVYSKCTFSTFLSDLINSTVTVLLF